MFALRREEEPGTTVRGDLRVVRLDVGRHQGAGIVVYLRSTSSSSSASCSRSSEHPRRHYAVVSVAAPPDPLVFAALPLRLVGVPVILDLHEATPVFFRTRFPDASNRVTDAILHAAERSSMALADLVLSVNTNRHQRLVALGAPVDKLRIVANGPSLERFQPEAHERRRFMADGTLRLVYAGAITPLYELDLVLRAMALLRQRRPDLVITWDLYGRGDELDRLTALSSELGLDDRVTFHGRVALDGDSRRSGGGRRRDVAHQPQPVHRDQHAHQGARGGRDAPPRRVRRPARRARPFRAARCSAGTSRATWRA